MLKEFIEMINDADMLNGCTQRDDVIIVEGEPIEVVIVTIVTSDSGDSVEVIFHKGTDTLFDMNVKHVCTCNKCKQ